MALSNYERMIKLADEVFASKDDPDQLDVNEDVIEELAQDVAKDIVLAPVEAIVVEEKIPASDLLDAVTQDATKKKKGEVQIENTIIKYMPCEWVVQFDNDEPQVFATADETVERPEVVITIPNTNQSIMTFTDSTTGKTFKFYARPKQ